MAVKTPAGAGSRGFPASGTPIAIVGMACKFPGADNLPAFWRLLETGQNAVTEGEPGSGVGRVGEMFRDSVPEKPACRFGAFVDGIDQFDAEFFRISPTEAQLLDPQQRMMLETSWQALEDAGIDPETLRGTRTAVYAGISNLDYRILILESSRAADPAESLYSVTGTSLNTAIGRVAFALGLHGPAMAVDTACSSSLVGLHQAANSLQLQEADVVLAGGVQAVLTGRLVEMRANAGMLAPDGRCKTFDSAANGYVRGEGCGMMVLKRLADAEADGDRIWGVLLGSAVNQDGASQGLTVPSPQAQQECITEALARAGVAPAEVDYLEAHGTGTPVGDPIEAHAADAAYGHRRPEDRPLLIGSVKTNFGHLESAAGVAGVMKAVLAMKHGAIPRHLNYQDPSPRIEWDRLLLQVTAEQTEWPSHPDRPPLAGVSAFGWSGTNAHVVLEGYGPPDTARAESESDGGQWPAGPARPIAVALPETGAGSMAAPTLEARPARLLPLSTRSPEAVGDLAQSYRSWLDENSGDIFSGPAGSDPVLSDMAWSAATGRSHFPHRAGLVFRDVASLRQKLDELAASGSMSPSRAATKVAFAYTGQASQWEGMGRALYKTEPVVRAVLDRCDAAMRELRGVSLLPVMFGEPGAGGELDDPGWTQPAIYTLECALAALWSSLGIRPDVVVGHSLGEIAAAQTAGIFSLEDGLRFAAFRGGLMSDLPEQGSMGAVFAPADRVTEAVQQFHADHGDSRLTIAADNGLHQVLSGPADEVEAVLDRFESEKVKIRRLRSSQGYHSALVEPALDELEAVLADAEVTSPRIEVVSSMLGRALAPGETFDGPYWRRQTRQSVRFRECVEALAEMGVDAVIEIGPGEVLAPMALMAWPQKAGTADPVTVPSLQRPSERRPVPADGCGFLDAVAAAYEAGLPVSLDKLFAGESRRRVPLPGYPFQRRRHWVEPSRHRRQDAGHPLLGVRHGSPRGETRFEAEMLGSDPAWLADHRVFGRVVMPGAVYGAMAASAASALGEAAVSSTAVSRTVVVEHLQLHSPLVFAEPDTGDESRPQGRTIQFVVDPSDGAMSQRFEIFSRAPSADNWTLHAEGRVSSGAGLHAVPEPTDIEALTAGLEPADISSIYQAKAAVGIDFGPAFHTLEAVWTRAGEAVAVVSVPDTVDRSGLDVHPILLDGCFQALSAARDANGATMQGTTYMPFGWERLRLTGALPERVVCHARMRDPSTSHPSTASASGPAEVLTGDLWLYSPDGAPLGELVGFTVKRATRAALLSAVEGLSDLLYEVVWRDRPLAEQMPGADFLLDPEAVAEQTGTLEEHLSREGVAFADRAELLSDLERLSRAYVLAALARLGWQRRTGDHLDPEDLRQQLGVADHHQRLFGRLLEMLAEAGVLEPADGGGWTVAVGESDPLPDEPLENPSRLAAELVPRHAHGSNELGLLRRCGDALAEVLKGKADPLALLFGDEPSAADLYLKAPGSRASNRLLADAVSVAVSDLPEGRRLRVLEVGAGTGSATAAILPRVEAAAVDYTFTDISAGFFTEAEERLSGFDVPIEYRTLDIESDPSAQGFDSHRYDLVIAANVLHATADLGQSLAHCRQLLAPSGQLVALEVVRGRAYQDLTFGLLDGWWRFNDSYRPSHALADAGVWRRALADAGLEAAEVLGADELDGGRPLGPGVIVARGPEAVREQAGVWLLAADQGGVASELAARLAACNQTVVLAGEAAGSEAEEADHIARTEIDIESRQSWRSVIESLPASPPLRGVVHLSALDGHGPEATTAGMAADVKRAVGSALALVQGLTDVDATPTEGVLLVTKGAQILERERSGQLAGATLWGFGKALAREAQHLRARMIDLDPAGQGLPDGLVEELFSGDAETHVAYRDGERKAARVVRSGSGPTRLALPEEPGWRLSPDPGGALEELRAEPVSPRTLEPGEVRVAVDVAGLNFRDVLVGMAMLEEGSLLGREMCGHIVETAPDVAGLATGDRVVGLGFGTFGPEVVTKAELVVPAPPGMPAAALAATPLVFTTAALAFDATGLKADERVLIHAASGGVGLAAIGLARAAGAEVFATASPSKQPYLRSLGVEHVFNSRDTAFGGEILEATSGEGVHVVVNSLTGEGFIEASLSCLAPGGRFAELGRRDIMTADQMAAVRADVSYSILELDTLKQTDPGRAGEVLSGVMARVVAGELQPPVHSLWPMSEATAAMEFMQSARHVGKNVLAVPPLARGWLRSDRTYLVTGGLGGIGQAVAGWLAERGAATIVLNGRRAPDPDAVEAIDSLRQRGVDVRVELADVTDAAAMDRMLARMDEALPPLAGIVHSVGVLSDGSIANQEWERFEKVLGPKVLGAWHLHRATEHRDLDLFVLFSSVAGVLGNSGQTNHGAANAFLDQLSRHRRARGLTGQTIAWGAWSGLGEAEEHRERLAGRLAASGKGWIPPEQGMKAFDRLVRSDIATTTVAAVDWPVYAEGFEVPPPLLEDLLVDESGGEADAAAAAEDLMSQLRAAPASEFGDLLASFLQRELQAVLRLPTEPSPAAEFSDLGMDSLMAVELRNRLNRAFAGEYVASNTVVFDYPDVTSLAHYLAGELEDVSEATAQPDPIPESGPEQAADPEPRPEPLRAVEPERAAEPEAERTPTTAERPRWSARRTGDEIAVVGMACRFPGAPDLPSFWHLLETGTDAVTDGRSDGGPGPGVVGDPASEDVACRRGGFVEEIDRFDSRFFRISPIEARMMDPAQRMLLETTWHALEDAGIDPARLKGTRTGVYAGVGDSEYRRVVAAGGIDDNSLGTAGCVTVGRIAFALGLEGPAMPVNTACASALAAVHQAVTALQRKEIDLALVGAVNAALSPAMTRFLTDNGLLSPDGRCKTFDASADGYVRGEGCGMVVLKRLSEAEADGDRIWAVVLGSAVNQNGATLGLTLPNGRAQQRAIADALERARVAPSEVDYLEAHGLGTKMGDPAEVDAAMAVYGQGRDPQQPLLLGSVKTNIGHLEYASGVAGLIKAVLAMRMGAIPAHLNFQNPNPQIQWDQLPVRVTSTRTDWPSDRGRPPRAGVNSFGISGGNAHVVLEGYAEPGGSDRLDPAGWPAGAPRRQPSAPADSDGESRDMGRKRLLPLSGKSPEALRDLAGRYLSWLDDHALESSGDDAATALLTDMAWTASIGRSHFAHRAAVVFHDAESLREGLHAVLLDVSQQESEPTPGRDEGPVEAAASDYEAGRDVDFAGLFRGETRCRVSLPVYPFQRRRHWV